jgi:DNA-binding beta-propeller fold protein YncE
MTELSDVSMPGGWQRPLQTRSNTGKVTKKIKLPAPAQTVTSAPDLHRLGPDKLRVWVAGLGGAAVLDARTGNTIKFLPILKIFRSHDPNMGALALSGSGRYVYIQDSTWPGEGRTGSISMIDTSSYRVLHHIPTGVLPEGLAIDTKRDLAYVPNYNDDTLTYFRTSP